MSGDEMERLPPELERGFAQLRERRAPPELWARLERNARARQRRRFAVALAAGMLVWLVLAVAWGSGGAEARDAETIAGPFGALALAVRDDVHRPVNVERSPELRLLREILEHEVK